MATKQAEAMWVESKETAGLFNKVEAHGMKDEKGRAVGATAVLFRNEDGGGFYGSVNPTRDGRFHGGGRANVRGSTFEEVAAKLDRQLAEARVATLKKYGTK